MKRKLLVAALLVMAALTLCAAALAADDPIVCSMEVSPNTLAAPGEVSVTITISNSGDTDMQDPLTLYSPTSEIVTNFGDQGSVTLKAGEVVTWTGKWDVNQRTLDNGQIVYFIKYFTYKANGEREAQSQPIRGKLNATEAKSDIEIKRTISPGTAREGQAVTVRYDIANTGTLSLKNITITEHKDVSSKAVTVTEELKPGEVAQVKFPVTMGKKDLTSSATITYTAGDDKTKLTQNVGEQKIIYGEAAMTALLTSSSLGVAINGTVTLTLELKNNGTVDYTDVRVTDETLGDVFTNQELASGATLKLEKEITLTQTTEYQFTVYAIDNTGTEVSLASDAVTVQAVDPDKMVQLNVITAVDRTEVYTQPGIVRFSVTVENIGEVDATDVSIYHGGVRIYTFPTIAAGETRKLTRDAALSMAGKYQFTAVTVDALQNSNSFVSNEIQIAFSVPTPAPATPTPPLVPTAVPTYAVVTVPPISDPSVGTLPKTIRAFFYPMMLIGLVLLAGALVLLGIATKKRIEQKRASDAALDHLDRAKRRDYITPGDEPDESVQQKPTKAPSGDGDKPAKQPEAAQDVELPHMKYVRNAQQRSSAAKTDSFSKNGSYTEENPLTDEYASQVEDDGIYQAYGTDRDLYDLPPTGKPRKAAPAAKPKDWSAYAKRPPVSAEQPQSYDAQTSYPQPDAEGDNAYYDESQSEYGYDDGGAYDAYAGDGLETAYVEDQADYQAQDGFVQDPLGYGDQSGYTDGQAAFDDPACYYEGTDDYAADPAPMADDPYADSKNETIDGRSADAGNVGRTRRRTERR